MIFLPRDSEEVRSPDSSYRAVQISSSSLHDVMHTKLCTYTYVYSYISVYIYIHTHVNFLFFIIIIYYWLKCPRKVIFYECCPLQKIIEGLTIPARVKYYLTRFFQILHTWRVYCLTSNLLILKIVDVTRDFWFSRVIENIVHNIIKCMIHLAKYRHCNSSSITIPIRFPLLVSMICSLSWCWASAFAGKQCMG